MVNRENGSNGIIFLLGFMGAGKSTLGKLLAVRLNLPFIDLDEYLEEEENCSIEEMFRRKGEAYFRACESFYLRLIIAKFEDKGAVVGTGGGLPCHSDNLDLMNSSGLTVYLKVSHDSLADRLYGASSLRPLAQGKSKDELHILIRDLLTSREVYYSGASLHFQIDPVQDKQVNASFLEEFIRENKKHYS